MESIGEPDLVFVLFKLSKSSLCLRAIYVKYIIFLAQAYEPGIWGRQLPLPRANWLSISGQQNVISNEKFPLWLFAIREISGQTPFARVKFLFVRLTKVVRIRTWAVIKLLLEKAMKRTLEFTTILSVYSPVSFQMGNNFFDKFYNICITRTSFVRSSSPSWRESVRLHGRALHTVVFIGWPG